MDYSRLKDRIRGCLLGVAIDDAFQTPGVRLQNVFLCGMEFAWRNDDRLYEAYTKDSEDPSLILWTKGSQNILPVSDLKLCMIYVGVGYLKK